MKTKEVLKLTELSRSHLSRLVKSGVFRVLKKPVSSKSKNFIGGAFNILRKTDSDFSFSKLAKKVGARIKEWLHPSKRIRPLPTKKEPVWLNLKPKSNLSPH
jgi:hypothetical protein